MNISGIRPSDGFYENNSIRIRPGFESASIEENNGIDNSDIAAEATISKEGLETARRRQTFGSYDYASQYNPQETYEMKGADSDINSLDVRKAVSDMEKDTAIHRYQYFVQNKNAQGADNKQVRGEENFTL